MRVITSTEFKNNFGKYIELGQREEIKVTKRGVTIFRIVPEKQSLVDRLESFFGILPEGTKIGLDPDERG